MRKLILIGVLALAACVTAKVPDDQRTAPPKPAGVDQVKPADQPAEPHRSPSLR